jgi:c-di-GMP-related signal transduction protein
MDIFVARQAIFDRNLKIFGYELLFRSRPADGYAMRTAPALLFR